MSSAARRRSAPLNIKPLVRRWRFFKLSTPENYGGSYFKNLLAEAPELVYMTPIWVFTCGYIGFAMWKQANTQYLTNKPYKELYTVIRPDDPRVKNIRTEYYQKDDDFGRK